MSFDLNVGSTILPGKVLFLTGGSRGIGSSTVRLFSSCGCSSFFIYKEDDDSAIKTLKNSIYGYYQYIFDNIINLVGEKILSGENVDNFFTNEFSKKFNDSLAIRVANLIKNSDDIKEMVSDDGYYIFQIYTENDDFLYEMITKLEELSTRGARLGGEMTSAKLGFFKGYVQDSTFVENSVDKTIMTVGKIDFLVNNAGISCYRQIQDLSDGDIINTMESNLFGAMYTTRAVAPYMLNKKDGRIITISSMWGSEGASCEGIYSATKGALNAFTKSMAKELGPSGINCNVVEPGVVDTTMIDEFTRKEKEELKKRSTLGRISHPDMIAKVVLFLAGDGGRDFCGQILRPDNGFFYAV